VSNRYGWHTTCYAVGSSGLVLLAVGYYFLQEPARIEPLKRHKLLGGRPVKLHKPLDSFLEIKNSFSLRLFVAAGGVRFVTEYAIVSFLPLYFMAKYPTSTIAFAVLNCLSAVGGAAVSSFLGAAVERAAEPRFGFFFTKMCFPAFISVLGVPILAYTLYVPEFYGAMFGIFLFHICTDYWFRPFMAVYQNALSADSQQFGVTFFTTVATVLGCVGAAVIGFCIDRAGPDGPGDPNNHSRGVREIVFTATVLSLMLFASLILVSVLCFLEK
jgi:hypothetical protein